MTPDLERVIADLQAPGVWAGIGDLQVDAVVALRWAQSKLAAAGELGDEVRKLAAGVRSGGLANGLVVRAEAARVLYEAVEVDEVKPAAPLAPVEDGVVALSKDEIADQAVPVVKPVRVKKRKSA